MMKWVTLSLTAAAVMGRLGSTLSPISLMPLFSSTFHHNCITLITSSQQVAKLRGEEKRRLLSGGTFPVQVLLLNLNLNTSRTLWTLVTKMNFERIPSQVLLLSHPDLRTSLRDSAECGKLVWLEEEKEGGHLIKLLDRYACTATVNTLKMLRSLTTGCPCSRTMRNRAKL